MPLFRRVIPCCLAILLIGSAAAVARADLSGDVRDVLKDKYLAKARAGVAIARLEEGSAKANLLFSSEGTTPLIPASNLKLITTAAALDRLGPDFKFRTHLLLKGEDLYLIGDGDPTMGDAEMLKPLGWDVKTIFKIWSDELLRTRNVNHVKNFYVDDSVFDENFLHPNWPLDQEHLRYVAQVGGINLNANCVDFIIRRSAYGEPVTTLLNPDTQYINLKNTCLTGEKDAIAIVRARGTNDVHLRGQTNVNRSEPISVTINDPPMFAATVLTETLAEAGITVRNAPTRERAARVAFAKEGEAGGWSVIGALETPIAAVLNRANKDSVNVYAEALCKRLGFAATNQPGTWLSGTHAMGEFLKTCGVSEDQFRLDDGCGLSKENGISAEAIVRVLAREFGGKNRQTFVDSLSVSGADGTLKDRFDDGPLRGRVFAKSGYVNYVGTLSGYVNTTDGSWYAFSILMNDVPFRTNNKAKALQEQIVNAIEANAKKNN